MRRSDPDPTATPHLHCLCDSLVWLRLSRLAALSNGTGARRQPARDRATALLPLPSRTSTPSGCAPPHRLARASPEGRLRGSLVARLKDGSSGPELVALGRFRVNHPPVGDPSVRDAEQVGSK